jgi:hypothetical protein
MTTKIKIIIVSVVAAAIAFLLWRRRAQASQLEGVYAATPSPMSATTALQTNVQQLPGLATQAAIQQITRLLPPVIGQGTQAVIGQTTPQPAAVSAWVASGAQALNLFGGIGRNINAAAGTPYARNATYEQNST